MRVGDRARIVGCMTGVCKTCTRKCPGDGERVTITYIDEIMANVKFIDGTIGSKYIANLKEESSRIERMLSV